MEKSKALNPRFTPQLGQSIKQLVDKELRQLLPPSTNVSVTTKISSSASSLKVQVIGTSLVDREFGSFRKTENPWFTTLKKQISPALSGLLSSSFKPKK